MRKVYIYALCDPDTGKPRYVGSSVHPKRRLHQHIAKRNFPKTSAKKRWIARLYEADKRPELKILDCCSGQERGEREDWWIDKLRGEGANLFNRKRAGAKQYDFNQKS